MAPDSFHSNQIITISEPDTVLATLGIGNPLGDVKCEALRSVDSPPLIAGSLVEYKSNGESSMRHIATLIFTVVVVGALPTLSLAQTGMTHIAKSVREIDKNFDVADKNHDGKLTREEAQSGSTPMISNHFDAIDTGHKGYVTKADVHTFIQRNLTRGHAAPASSSSSP